MLGHFVMVGPAQFPQLHRMVVEGTQTVGLKEVPATFVYNSSGVMNAMALRLVGRSRYIWLTSALIDCDDEDQVRFVVGHELGHHVAGHLDEPWSYLRLPAHFIPFLAPAYSRARELTCDRVGVFVARNLQASRTALQMLACGSAKLNRQMNPDAFQAQERMVPGIAGFVLNAISGYPRLTRRVEAVTQFYAGANTRAEPAPARAQAVQPA
ncbi:M48 family metallopeptidase [Bosea caraganae]|nr:M48 family metallopeptidase [Bosea caraganae]